MTARYLQSEIEKDILATIDRVDRTAPNFFVEAPFVIDCRDDAQAFRSRLTERQRDFIPYRYDQGRLTFVNELARPAKEYAMEKLQERYVALDHESVAKVRAFLSDWQREDSRVAGQASKRNMAGHPAGIQIILPISGIRLDYELSDSMFMRRNLEKRCAATDTSAG